MEWVWREGVVAPRTGVVLEQSARGIWPKTPLTAPITCVVVKILPSGGEVVGNVVKFVTAMPSNSEEGYVAYRSHLHQDALGAVDEGVVG